LYYLAFTEYKQGAFGKTAKHIALAREFTKGQPDEIYVSGRLDQLDGLMAYTKKEYKNAEQLLKASAQKLKDGGGANNFRAAEALVQLGRTYIEMRFSGVTRCV